MEGGRLVLQWSVDGRPLWRCGSAACEQSQGAVHASIGENIHMEETANAEDLKRR